MFKTERTREEIRRQDRWQNNGGETRTKRSVWYPDPVRVLPWPKPGVDGVPEDAPEPPGMDEVWPGRAMEWCVRPTRLTLTGAPPVWAGGAWVVLVRDESDLVSLARWGALSPIPTKTTLTITTDDPDAVREALRTLKGVEVGEEEAK